MHRYGHSAGEKKHTKTKPPRVVCLEPLRDVTGVGGSSLCKHRLPLTKSGLIHQPGFDKCLWKPFLWVEKRATQLEGGGDSQSRFGRLSGTQKQTTRGTQEGTGHCQPFGCKGKVPLPFLHRAAPAVRFRHPRLSRRHRSVSSQRRFRRACPDEMAPRALRLSSFPGSPSQTPRRGPGVPRSRAAPGIPRRQRPGPERSPTPAALGLRAGPAAATLSLSPPGPGCPFRPTSFPAPASVSPSLHDLERIEKQPRGGPCTSRLGKQLPANLAWPWQPGLTTPNRRAADSQPPSYHPTTADARAVGNIRSPRCRPLE